ncbi:MAG: DUF4402 domain-containing protein [Proteobacteria bacterium]|nr:DUF4402 domain-containing protein [Pseudomonadota bacterium]
MKAAASILAAAAGLLALGAAAPAQAGQVTATALATVTILDPSSITPVRGLSFGAVTRPANGQANTVAMDASGRVVMSGAGNGAVGSSGFAAARVELAGAPGQVYSVSQSLSFEGQGLSHAVGALAGSNGAARVIPASGVDVLSFGGSFQVDRSTPDGRRVGALNIIANYN